MIAKIELKYPRYQPNRLRPAGAGAFFDFAAGVESRNPGKLKSSRLARRWGKAPMPAEPKEPEA